MSKIWHFSKGVNPFYWSKNANFFFIWFWSRLNNVLDRKETFFEYKNKTFQSPKNGIFLKGLTHAFGQKMPNFSLFGFGQNKTKKNAQ